MNSIGENCTDLKKQYDDCFNSWFSEKFLRGSMDDTVCSGIFSVYQQCVKNAMKEQNLEFKEVEKDILGSSEEYHIPPKKEKPSWHSGSLLCLSSPLTFFSSFWTGQLHKANTTDLKLLLEPKKINKLLVDPNKDKKLVELKKANKLFLEPNKDSKLILEPIKDFKSLRNELEGCQKANTQEIKAPQYELADDKKPTSHISKLLF